LAEFLLEKGYCVHGIIRRSSSFNTARIDHIFDKAGMMGDAGGMIEVINVVDVIEM